MPPPSEEARGFRFVSERERLNLGFFRVTSGTFVGPDGFTFEREIVRHPGAVCIVPLEADGDQVVMVRQYRAPIDAMVLEFPAGKRDIPGEPPETCAVRELEEEVGRRAGALRPIGVFVNSPGFNDEETHCFLATSLEAVVESRQGIEEQHMTIETVSVAHFWELVDAGELIDAKSIVAMTLAERALQR